MLLLGVREWGAAHHLTDAACSTLRLCGRPVLQSMHSLWRRYQCCKYEAGTRLRHEKHWMDYRSIWRHAFESAQMAQMATDDLAPPLERSRSAAAGRILSAAYAQPGPALSRRHGALTARAGGACASSASRAARAACICMPPSVLLGGAPAESDIGCGATRDYGDVPGCR